MAIALSVALVIGRSGADEVALAPGLLVKRVATVATGGYSHSVVVNTDGKFLATFDGAARVWDLANGRQIAYLPDVGGGSGTRSIALLGDPCLGVAGELGVYDSASPDRAANVAIFSCAGTILASLRVDHLARAYVEGMAVVPACGLVLAQYLEGVVVIDAKARTVREDLSRLFPRATERVAGAWRSCVAYAAVEATGQPSQILRIDLQKQAVLELVSLPETEETSAPTFQLSAPMSVSPDDRLVAVATQRYERPGMREEHFAERRIETFDGATGAAISNIGISALSGGGVYGMAFLDDRRIAVAAQGGGMGAYIVDASSGAHEQMAFDASKAFDLPYTLSYAPAARRLAVAGESEVRIYDLVTRRR